MYKVLTKAREASGLLLEREILEALPVRAALQAKQAQIEPYQQAAGQHKRDFHGCIDNS